MREKLSKIAHPVEIIVMIFATESTGRTIDNYNKVVNTNVD